MTRHFTTEAQYFHTTDVANYATFEGGVQQVYIACDDDIYVTFDEQIPVVGGHALLVKKDMAPVRIDFRGGSIQKVWAITAASAMVYLLGVRN